MEDGRWEEQEYSLRQETHDWLFTYGFRYRSQRVMKDEMAVFVSATLRAFPRIGLALKGVDLGTTN
jgi:hypothetical protein